MRRREWDRKAQGKALYTRTEDYANEVSRLYSKAVNDLLALRKKYKLNDNKEFLYENDPKVAEEAQAILRSLYSAVYSAVTNDIKLEWNKANEEIDGFVKSTFGKQTLKEIGNNGWFERNTDALDAFLKRSNNGMNLSQRIWKYTDQFKDEMEMAMTVAIGEGSSAQHISKLVRKYLVEPDKLFRKVRTSTNEDGTPKYRLSKNAALYHPGRGVYRSSYKNAMRLTRTETNMAYRNADHERLQKLDFVIGVRINLSRSHPEPDICDTLAGDYPKGFKFTGWHPQCFCYATTILIDDKTNKEYIKASLRGKKMDLSKYQITDVPQAYKTWVKDNSERITNAIHGKGELPYFLRDNGTVNDEGEYVIDAFDIPQQEESSIQPLSLAEIAERRHEARTETQIADIKARWNEREEKLKALLLQNTATTSQTLKHETLVELKQRLGDKIPKTLEHLDEVITKYEQGRHYSEDVREHKEEIEEVMKQLFDKYDFGMQIPEGALEKVADSWFMNTFETGTSGGYLGKKFDCTNPRIRQSQKAFFNPKINIYEKKKKDDFLLLERKQYEKYGCLMEHDILKDVKQKGWCVKNKDYAGDFREMQYGNVQVRFKKDKVLATWTPCDSLDENTSQPSLVSDPRASSYDNLNHYCGAGVRNLPTKNSPKDLCTFREKQYTSHGDYIELQYHGDLTIDCVESIAFPYDIESKESIVFKRGLKAAQKWKEKGVKIYYLKDGKLKEF